MLFVFDKKDKTFTASEMTDFKTHDIDDDWGKITQ
jgi:hypothetical protein